MSVKYCDECRDELDLELEDCERCWGCEVHYCETCAASLKKDPPFILMCQKCELEYGDAMNDYDESAEREAIGDRDGGYDQYDNRNGW